MFKTFPHQGRYCRDHFVDTPSQWEMTLQCYVVSHWLGASTRWSLGCWTSATIDGRLKLLKTLLCSNSNQSHADPRPTNSILIEFEIRSKFGNALVSNMPNQSQRNFAHVTTVTLSWRVQNFDVIGSVHFKPEHGKFWSNFEFDRNIVSGTATRSWTIPDNPGQCHDWYYHFIQVGNLPHDSDFIISYRCELESTEPDSVIPYGWEIYHVILMAQAIKFPPIWSNILTGNPWWISIFGIYRQTHNIRCIKPHDLSITHLVLQLSLAKPLRSGGKSRMKMKLEQCRQAMLNYIWVINNFTAYYNSTAPYIRGLTVYGITS